FHLLWRLVDDFTRLGHGNPLGLDARESPDRADGAPCNFRSTTESGLVADRAVPVVLLAAGGTGGHLFPAEALPAAPARRGVSVDLATDARGGRYGGKFPARRIHVIPSETVRARNPVALARTSAALGWGLVKAWLLLAHLRPSGVVGFGGYPTV